MNLLIDGNNLLWRYCSVAPTAEIAASNFLRAIVERKRRINKPFTSTVMTMEVMDKGRETPAAGAEGYKASRKPVPELHVEAANLVNRVLQVMPGISYYMVPDDVEADAVLAQFVAHSRSLNTGCMIVSSDKDMCQLVHDDHPPVSVIRPERDWMEFRTEQVTHHYNVPPSKIPILLSLMGDKSDNIAGIPGWGKVNAAKAANNVSTLEDLKSLQLTPKLKEALLSNWATLEDNFYAVNLMDAPPLKIPEVTPNDPHAMVRAVSGYSRLGWLLSVRF